VRDGHLGAFCLTLDAALCDHKTRANHRCPVASTDVGIDDQIGDAELIFERDENDALRCARPLPHEHDDLTHVRDNTAVHGPKHSGDLVDGGEDRPPSVVLALCRVSSPRSFYVKQVKYAIFEVERDWQDAPLQISYLGGRLMLHPVVHVVDFNNSHETGKTGP
jgi:hypothetical protein